MKRILSLFKKLLPSMLQIIVVVAFLITAIIAYNLGAGSRNIDRTVTSSNSATSQPTSQPAQSNSTDSNGDGVIYTCSMHPQIKQNEPGNCPICGMELVKENAGTSVETDSSIHSDHATRSEPEILGYACAMNCVPPLEEPGDCPICGMEMQAVVEDNEDGPITGDPKRRLSMSAEAKALASIETSEVIRRVPTKTVRLVGQLAINEETLAHISADVGGRIDVLSAEYAGDTVQQGEELVLLYSPELLAVQQELIQAIAALERLPDNSLETAKRSSESAVLAARDRLRLAGMGTDEIDAIAESGEAREQVTLKAPISGTVIERHIEEGAYVDEGERILTIANLKTLWAEMEAYESDLMWLKVGQPVTFTSEAFPGETFTGEVSWIDPMTNVRTRTTNVRLEVENDQGLVRPGMYLTANVESTLGEEPRLVIPATAPLITGERAIVYLEVPDVKRPTFQGIEVILGARVEEGYVVNEGLVEGQRVVTNGAFQIDSALQIVAKSSMMNPGGDTTMTGHEGHGTSSMGTKKTDEESPSKPTQKSTSRPASISLDELISGYLHIQRALANDDFEHAQHVWQDLSGSHKRLNEIAETDEPIASMEELRAAFEKFSRDMIALVQEPGTELHQELRLVHCPMAFDFTGADWLQAEEAIRNPYFGDEMLTCGVIKREWSGHD